MSTTTDTYNGWANRATWLVALHLNNDYATQSLALETADIAYRDAVANLPSFMEDDRAERVDRYAVSIVADNLRGMVEDMASEALDFPSERSDHPYRLLTSDLALHHLSFVDWSEVAEAFLEDVDRVTDLQRA